MDIFNISRVQIIICLCVLFSVYIVKAQSLDGKSIDSLKILVNKKKIDSNTVNLYADIAYHYYYTNIDSSLYYAKKAYCLSQEISFLSGESEAIGSIAAAYFETANYKEALMWSEKGMKLAKKIDNINDIFHFNTQLGLLHETMGNYEKAIVLFQKNIEIADHLQNDNWKAETLEYIGIVYSGLGEYEKSIEYYEKAIEIFQVTHEENNQILAQLYGNLSNSYGYLEEYSKAIDYMNKTLVLFEKLDQKSEIAQVYDNLGKLHFLVEEYDKSEAYINKSMALAVEIKNNSTIMFNYLTLGGLSEEKGRYSEAMNHYQKGLKHAADSNTKSLEVEFKNAIVKLLAKQGNYQKAFQDLQKLNILKDSVFGIEKLKAIEKLQIAFDVEKKDAEITLLQKDKQIQKIEKDNLLKLQMIFIVSGVLLLLLLGALFNRFKNSQKLLKTISKKNTENELLVQEIHHRVKNNLQIVLSLLGSYADRKDTDDNTIQILTETQNKIKSMALIHQNLYGNGNFNSTLATHYFRNLIDNIRQTYIGTKSKNIKVITSIEEVSLETKMAIPLGLIVNELLTNAYKYAFENIEDNNQVDISFSKSDKNILHLNIKDNGIGLASTFDLKNVESFGMQIVQGLVQQLGGQMDVTTEPGTNYNINIPL